jgi:hypothetical protein
VAGHEVFGLAGAVALLGGGDRLAEELEVGGSACGWARLSDRPVMIARVAGWAGPNLSRLWKNTSRIRPAASG